MDKSRVFQNPRFLHTYGQIPGFFKIPNFAWTNPEVCMDKSRILHGQIPNFAWTNPEFCTLWGIPCYFKTSVFLKNSPFKVHFTIPYKKFRVISKIPLLENYQCYKFHVFSLKNSVFFTKFPGFHSVKALKTLQKPVF